MLAYHKDVPTELYVPLAFAVLAVAAFLLYRGLREPALHDAGGRSNWGATGAIALGLVALAATTLAWFLPTEAETGARRTIGDVSIVIALVYALLVGPVLGLAAIILVRSRGQKRRAIGGFLFGFAGVAFSVGAIVACMVSDGCFH